MRIIRIMLWTWISLVICSGLVQADEKVVGVEVHVQGTAGTVIVEDAEGKEIERVRVEAGQKHMLQLQATSLSERRYRIRQTGNAEKVKYDTRVYEVTVCSYLDDNEQEVCIAVISCNGKKRETVVFENQKAETPIPKTGDESKTWAYGILLIVSACGLWITVARRRKIR